jgi:hypothetical protein
MEYSAHHLQRNAHVHTISDLNPHLSCANCNPLAPAKLYQCSRMEKLLWIRPTVVDYGLYQPQNNVIRQNLGGEVEKLMIERVR